MILPTLDARLRSVAELVRQGAVLADIGTDHAYLPLFLLSEGKILRAICSDVNKGPLDSAREHARALGFEKEITFLLTDGLRGVMRHSPTDISVCGMGGELIASILAQCPDAHREDLRFLLQPMSRQEFLRERLYALGFEVERDVYTLDGDKPYLTMLVRYTGTVAALSVRECLLGKRAQNFDTPPTPMERAYFLKKEKALLRRMTGKRAGGEDANEEELLLSALAPILHDTKE